MMGRRELQMLISPSTTHPMRSLEQMTTDSSGTYEFCNLSSDDYYIVVDNLAFPDGYEITAQKPWVMMPLRWVFT